MILNMKYLEIWLALINLSALLMVGYDKHQAKANLWRVPESRFFLLALLGGAAGVFAGMRAFRHKTKHPLFTLGIPVMLVINLVCLYLILVKFQG